MVFLQYLSAVGIDNRGMGGMGGKVGWHGWSLVGGGKNHCLGHPISSHVAHTVANDTPVGHTVSGSKSRSPTAQLAPSMGAIVPAMTLDGRQNALQKSKPVNIQHLTHWGWIDIECVCKLWQ